MATALLRHVRVVVSNSNSYRSLQKSNRTSIVVFVATRALMQIRVSPSRLLSQDFRQQLSANVRIFSLSFTDTPLACTQAMHASELVTPSDSDTQRVSILASTRNALQPNHTSDRSQAHAIATRKRNSTKQIKRTKSRCKRKKKIK